MEGLVVPLGGGAVEEDPLPQEGLPRPVRPGQGGEGLQVTYQ